MSGLVVTTEVPGVNNAVGRLEELSVRMKDEEFGFKDNDVDNIDNIIEAVLELEAERSKVHELLETETIKSSVLRHKLLFLPAIIKEEITKAVNSARESNTAEIQRLQNELDTIIENTKTLMNKHQELEQENSVLHPQRDEVRVKHEEIIAGLNQRMAEKATKQILLNETRDKLRATNQHIVDMEEGIVQLREDMIQERADARLEKKRLKKAIDDTTRKTLDQKAINIEKKKELDILQEKLMESENQLDTLRKDIRRLDTSRAKMEGQERALNAQLGRELKHNHDIRKKTDNIEHEIASLENNYEQEVSKLQKNIDELDEDIVKATSKNERLVGERMKLELGVKDAETIMYADATKVNELTKLLRDAKERQAKKAEDIARMNEQTIDMKRQIQELDESHEAVMNQLQKQIEESRDQLGRERKDRMEMQQRKDDVERTVETFKGDNSKFMAEVNRKVTEGKKQHEQLTQEGHFLQRAIREDEETIITLQKQLVDRRKSLNEAEESMLKKLSDLELSIQEMESQLVEKEAYLTDHMPGFEEMEKAFRERTEEYDKFKKQVVSLKNKRSGLEDSVKRTKLDIEKALRPQDKLKCDLKYAREETLLKLREQTMETKNIETEIYELACKLKTAMDENAKFRQAILRMEKDSVLICEDMQCNKELHEKLEVEHSQFKEVLKIGWNEDKTLERTVENRDLAYISEISSILKSASKRENKIGNITSKLYEELSMLAGFLDNVARRRPIESRDGRQSRRVQSKSPEKHAVEAVAAVNSKSQTDSKLEAT